MRHNQHKITEETTILSKPSERRNHRILACSEDRIRNFHQRRTDSIHRKVRTKGLQRSSQKSNATSSHTKIILS